MIDVKFYPKERTISLHYLDYAATTPVVEEVKKAIFEEMAYKRFKLLKKIYYKNYMLLRMIPLFLQVQVQKRII